MCHRASVHNGARPAAPEAGHGRVGAQGFTARVAAATMTTARSSFECDEVVCSSRQVLVRLGPIYRWQRSSDVPRKRIQSTCVRSDYNDHSDDDDSATESVETLCDRRLASARHR